jgi:ABC-type Mn2+/Zn2+ transport system ATPase subunit
VAREQQRAGVETAAVRRTFGDVVAVDHVDLTAPPGSVTALVGPNGSGKTTLLLILATLLRPDSGTVWVANSDPVTDPQAVRAVTGWMPDSFGTYDTAADNSRRSAVRSRPRLGLEWCREYRKAVWPYGLAFNMLLGLGALTLTIRRLRTPYERLPRGVRVA